MTGLYERMWGPRTPEEQAAYELARADHAEHAGQRACPKDCGCVEFFDDRHPDIVTGGFGAAGCECPRCNGVAPELSDAEAQKVRWFGIHDDERRRATYRHAVRDAIAERAGVDDISEWPLLDAFAERRSHDVDSEGLAAIEEQLRLALAERLRELAEEAWLRLAAVSHKTHSMEKAAEKATAAAFRAAVDLVEGHVL